MTRDDVSKLLKFTDEQLALLTCVELAALERHARQAKASDMRVEKLIQEHTAKVKELQDQIGALGGTEAAIALRKKAERERHLKQIEESRKALKETGE